MIFSDLQLIEPILTALEDEGYTTPTPIQSASIPLLLAGHDLLGVAQTGTGKTAAFSIPILQRMESTAVTHAKGVVRPIRTLILTPTRELALQIEESIKNYGKNLHFRSRVIFGGVGQHAQVDALRKGVDIVIATPGRLLDLMEQRHVDLRKIEFFVLDEADRMLDMGFVHDVKKIIAKLPSERQSLFFSATMPDAIVELSKNILKNPKKVEVTPPSSTAHTIDQVVYFVDKHNKKELLKDILREKKIERVLVFTRTKHGADKVVRDLEASKISARAIHGNKSQNNRQAALTGFKNREIRVLVATDIAARGIDIDELTHVINFELPNIPESYVHRIGRTGRAGADGIAIAFCDGEEKAYLRDIEKLISKKIPIIDEHKYPLMHDAPEDTTKKPQRKEFKKKAPPQRKQESVIKHQPSSPKGHQPKKPENTIHNDALPKPGEKLSWRRTTKRSERSFSKNKEKSYTEKTTTQPSKNPPFPKSTQEPQKAKTHKKPISAPTEKNPLKTGEMKKAGSPHAKKPNPKPFVPQPPKRWSEKN